MFQSEKMALKSRLVIETELVLEAYSIQCQERGEDNLVERRRSLHFPVIEDDINRPLPPSLKALDKHGQVYLGSFCN